MKKHVPFIVNLFITIAIAACVMLCLQWLPLFLFAVVSVVDVSSKLVAVICGLIAIPLFVILGLGYGFSTAIKNDTVFSLATAKRLKLISVLLFADCGVFCALIAALLCLGELWFSPLLGFMGLVGLMVAYVLLLLSGYVKNAAALQEEVDATL